MAALQCPQGVYEHVVEQKLRTWWKSGSGDVYPHVIKFGPWYVLQDGNHRVERFRRLGHRWIWVRIWTVRTY